jgi:hypothetical protein
MRNTISLLILSLLISINAYSQRNQKIKLFGEKIKAQEVTGINKFNDLGTFAATSVINDLTDDLNTFLWRLGTVRINKNNYREGVFSLFDLSNYNNSNGYPILDLIDFKYYSEVGFNLLEKKDSTLLKNKNYSDFKSSFIKGNLEEKRKILWLDSNNKIREKLFNSKYYVNIQPITNVVSKKLKRTITDTLTIDFKNIIDKIPTEKLNSTNKAKLTNYLQNVNEKNKNILFEGQYVSAVFNTRYVSIIDFIISGVKKEELDINNEFEYNLKRYLENVNDNSKDIVKYALNSAVYGFKFSGSYDLVKTDSLDIKTELDITADLSAEISNKLNLEIEKTYNRTFKNEFDKLWIIMFATDGVLYKLNSNKR